MIARRYADALASTLAWLQIEQRGWGVVVVPATEQREIAETLQEQLPTRPVLELHAETPVNWFDEVVAASDGTTAGAFLVLRRELTDDQQATVLTLLNGQRDRAADRGLWVLVVSARELSHVRRHAPDLASTFRSFEAVEFVPRAMTDAEVAAARADLHAHYKRRFGRLDLRGFIRSEQEDVSFSVEQIFQPLRARPSPSRVSPFLQISSSKKWRELKHGSERGVRILDLGSVPLQSALESSRRNALQVPALLVGGPGSGKSFFLRWCALEGAAAATFLAIERPLPVYVSLAALRATASPSIELHSYILDELLDAGLSVAHAIDARACEGEVVYLLDGLDEVGARQQDVLAAVEALHRRYPMAMFIVTSRPAGLEEPPFEVNRFDLEGLDDDALRALLTAWCELYETQRIGAGGAARGRAEGARLAEQVLASATLSGLARLPLMATIIAIVHRAGVRLPDHRVELYDHIVKILVERWNQLRNRDVGHVGPVIRMGDAIRLLGPVAQEMVASGRDAAISEASLQGLLARPLQRGTVHAFRDAEEAIGVFRDTLGLLVEHSPGVYAFLHKTLGEFLAAHDVVRTGSLERLLAPSTCFAPAWREVVLLALGIVGTLQADDDRLGRAVDFVLENARSPLADQEEVPRLIAGIVLDDPALSPELAQRACNVLAELLMAPESNWHESMQDCTRILGGMWRAPMVAALKARYRAGLDPDLDLTNPFRYAILVGLLRSAGAPRGPFDCEALVAHLLDDPAAEGGVVSEEDVELELLAPELWRLRVAPDSACHHLLRHGAGTMVSFASLDDTLPEKQVRHRPCELRGEEVIVRGPVSGWRPVSIAYSIPANPAERARLLPVVLSAWHDLAALFPD